MEDSEEHLVEEISLSSDKGIWEVIKRKRPRPIRVDGSEEESVEQESPPAKKLAMAEAVANALNKSFEIKEKKKEKNIDPPMEIIPLNPAKRPKIQTEAFATPKGKSQPKSGEVSEGNEGPLTKSRFDLGIPEDILKLAPSQADGIYSTLVERMAEDGDWVDRLWSIR